MRSGELVRLLREKDFLRGGAKAYRKELSAMFLLRTALFKREQGPLFGYLCFALAKAYHEEGGRGERKLAETLCREAIESLSAGPGAEEATDPTHRLKVDPHHIIICALDLLHGILLSLGGRLEDDLSFFESLLSPSSCLSWETTQPLLRVEMLRIITGWLLDMIVTGYCKPGNAYAKASLRVRARAQVAAALSKFDAWPEANVVSWSRRRICPSDSALTMLYDCMPNRHPARTASRCSGWRCRTTPGRRKA
jgi:hypothetical protein